ncbi:alanine racemase [Brachybacterium sp. JHP9]|uniref:Alanine racemase n=1 Tax=Brachybacterium equifaecis TaxID=2910770 RepID=A0ABT0R084_9MICO|nr:alanine racemase [Brachybacterium equifaecis]MCL6423312.1 alanine racemase [Brachybacterium equifaecis]
MDDVTAQSYLGALEDAGLRSRPVVVLDLDAVDANLADLRRRAGGTPIRVASKSLRVRSLIGHALAEPGFSGVLAFTLAEALHLCARGIDDIVLAYPTADRERIRALAADERAREQITLMIDSSAQLDLISAAAPGHPPLRIALELDAAYAPLARLRFGALRSPVRTPAQLRALAAEALSRPGFRIVGMMAYEGQIAGVADVGRGAFPRAVRAMKIRSAREIAERRGAAAEALRAMADLEFVNAGGTGSIETSAAEPAVTEVAAGSGIVGPGLFDGYTAFRPAPALHFGLDVVRRPGPLVATILGGGWIASGAPGADRLPTIAWPSGLRYARDEGAGEVQTPLVGPAAAELRVGDVVWLRHAKAGELAEHAESYAVVRRVSGALQVIDQWPTYRGEGLSTL